MQARPSLWRLLLRVFVRLGLGLVLLSALCVVVAGASLPAHAAPAATLTVTDCSGETGPGRIGTVLSLASALDTITFSCSGTIPITSTLTISTNNLTLQGSGQSVTLDGGNSTPVLLVNSGISFTLNALTIAHGSTSDAGGGLDNAGTVSITNSTFANNSASGIGGGGLASNGTVTISNSIFANNSANIGGGLASRGTVTISNSIFANNSASVAGGGLANIGTVNITNSTFASNSASVAGGGLANGGPANTGTVNITNSTFANNSASMVGGGLANSPFGTATISNSTFANNSANGGGGLANLGTVNISGSIVANNTGGNCHGGGPITDQGYNLESASDCGFTGTGSLQNTDPKLDPNGLQNNGGPTQTLALEPDSAAVDHLPVGSSCPATDQRGVSRPQGPACDIGAFEMTAADGVTVMIHVVNSFHLTRSLQTALDNKLQDVLGAITAGQTATACSELTDFSGHVQSQSGKRLTTAQATQLVNEATVIATRLGC